MIYICTMKFSDFDAYLAASSRHYQASIWEQKPNGSAKDDLWGLTLVPGTILYSSHPTSPFMKFPVSGAGLADAFSEKPKGLSEVNFEALGAEQ